MYESVEENTIRTDLWPTMTTSQLTKQLEIVQSKITLLTTMPSTPTVVGMLHALIGISGELTTLLGNTKK